MSRSSGAPAPPRVSPPDLPSVLDVVRGLRPRVEVARSDIVDLADAVDATHATLEECRIHDGAVASLDMTGATLVDVHLRDLRATVLTARRARLRRVRLNGGRIGTLDLAESDLDEVELRGIRVDYISLGAARLRDVLVADCTIATIDLPQATLARVRFENSTVDEVDTRGLRATDVDLRNLHAGAYTDVSSLRGATLSTVQVEQLAPALAVAFGIRVSD